MTRNFKLSHGDIVEIVPDGEDSVVQSIHGKFSSIVSEAGSSNVHFVLKDGDDVLRLRVKRTGLPCARLLTILAASLALLPTVAFTISSVKTDNERDSRLRVRFDGQDTDVEARQWLSRFSIVTAPRKISLINDFMAIAKGPGETVDMSAQQEPGNESPADAAGFFPLLVIFSRSLAGQDAQELISMINECEMFSRCFVSEKKRDTFIANVKDAASAILPHGSIAFLKDADAMTPAFVAYAERLNGRDMSCGDDDAAGDDDDNNEDRDRSGEEPHITVNENEEY